LEVDNNLDSNEDETVIDTVNNSISFSKGKLDSHVKKEGSKEVETESSLVDTKETNRTIKVQERQNSFKATRNFFADQKGGLIIGQEEYKKYKRKGMDAVSENQDNGHTSNPHNMSNK
jgi:hypothetical protein